MTDFMSQARGCLCQLVTREEIGPGHGHWTVDSKSWLLDGPVVHPALVPGSFSLWSAFFTNMNLYFAFGLLLTFFVLPGTSLAELVFRCSSCTAENMIGCPRVDADCTEVVREPGCGCCPVCARMEGEFCGVYTPRCSSGLICYPTMDAELPLEQLIQGFGRCVQKIDESTTITVEHPATNGKSQKPHKAFYT